MEPASLSAPPAGRGWPVTKDDPDSDVIASSADVSDFLQMLPFNTSWCVGAVSPLFLPFPYL